MPVGTTKRTLAGNRKQHLERRRGRESLESLRSGLRVIGSSIKVHGVDALAMTGDERRGSLRKAAGSWQTSIDPQISEWGNPALNKWLLLKAI
jgi:hypothetical protein